MIRKERSTKSLIQNKMKAKMILSVFMTIGAALLLFAKQQPSAVDIKKSIENGRTIYTTRCLTCHQKDGGGVPHLNAPLDGATAVIGNDKAKLIKIVLKGMTDRVEIDGEYYSNNMTPHGDLKDQQVADVLTFVRNSWTNKASAVTAAEVKAARAKLK
jgi:mono/diheme cytochrome c family protein